ncbi:MULTISPECIES: SMP-30/gluconolactonase/LRE family protein [unclassified Streptomyces]|uniref:SMP-30/gluconolactonase/LRE family protein n=1 Tax=unclassified Streptomyces TaxID=2593676 RepID=UPI002E36B035|nr:MULTISPECIES: SMP-30/gluconolactonase/LRE family protein [unclassified Streptomyces]WUC64833.1 SMP-30/gluconolactonase/LRE family protein [Streptomyces sp. NBC_00539]
MRFSALTTSRTTSRITSRATSRAIPLAAALAAVLTLGAAPADATTAPRLSTAFVLPGAKVYPEGITSDPRTGTVYVGSYADGTVYRARPGQDTAEVFLPAGTDGRHTANGLSVDAHGRLWVTDSTNGVAVYDTRTGSRLARFGIPGGAPSFVNDLALTPDGTAYLTDSLRAAVYRVTPAQLAAGSGVLEVAYDLSGGITPPPGGGVFLNGIVADPAGRFLLTVDMTAGDLHRIDLRTGALSRVTLRGGDLKHGDGLQLSPGGVLRVAHNTTNTLTRWQLTPSGTAARLTRTLTDPALQIPTTLTHTPGRTLVVRSQFDKDGPMTPSTGTPTTFTVASVRGL